MMQTFAFTADTLTLEDPVGVSLANAKGDWLGLAYDENEDAYDDDPTSRIYFEAYDQGNGCWGGIERCELQAAQFTLRIRGELEVTATVQLQLGPAEHSQLAQRLKAVFTEAPDRLRLA